MNDVNWTKAMFGQHAVHVPVWMWVQSQGAGPQEHTVILAGASRVQSTVHPARYGSEAVHQFILGEVIIRPHLVFETDHYRGQGISGLLRSGVDVKELCDNGNLILDPMGMVKR